MPSLSQEIASCVRFIDEKGTGKELGRISSSPFDLLPLHFPGKTEKRQEKVRITAIPVEI